MYVFHATHQPTAKPLTSMTRGKRGMMFG